VANRFELVEGVLLQQVGGDLLVVVPDSLETLRLSGDVAITLLAIHRGEAVDCVGPNINDLIKLGIVSDRSKVSRRGLIRAGAVGVGAGIAVLALPSAAAASSLRITGQYFFAGVPGGEGAYLVRILTSDLGEFAGSSIKELYVIPAGGIELGPNRSLAEIDGYVLFQLDSDVIPPSLVGLVSGRVDFRNLDETLAGTLSIFLEEKEFLIGGG
jgi:hypothetical protein